MTEHKNIFSKGYFDRSRLIPSPRWDLFFTPFPWHRCVLSVWRRINREEIQRAYLFYLLLWSAQVRTRWQRKRAFTKHFIYLGSFVLYNTFDDYDVDRILASADSSMVALYHFWKEIFLDLSRK